MSTAVIAGPLEIAMKWDAMLKMCRKSNVCSSPANGEHKLEDVQRYRPNRGLNGAKNNKMCLSKDMVNPAT